MWILVRAKQSMTLGVAVSRPDAESDQPPPALGRHDREHSHGEGLRQRLAHVFNPHSHDTADQVDSALVTSELGLRALWISFAALALTAVVQLGIVLLSGSVGLLSDTLHNFADALTAIPLAFAFVVGRRPANQRYTYGYGRAEDLAGAFILVVIAGSALLAGYSAIDRLLHPRPVSHLGAVAAAAVIGFAGNEAVARYRIIVGRRIGSAALVADGLHARTDGFTSLAVLAGAAGVAIGWDWADPAVGLGITLVILLVLRDAARAVYHRLMDAVDPAVLAQATTIVTAVPGALACRSLRLRWVGHDLLAEADIEVDPALSVGAAHAIAHEVEDALISQIPRLTSATVHTGPYSGGAEHPAV